MFCEYKNKTIKQNTTQNSKPQNNIPNYMLLSSKDEVSSFKTKIRYYSDAVIFQNEANINILKP